MNADNKKSAEIRVYLRPHLKVAKRHQKKSYKSNMIMVTAEKIKEAIDSLPEKEYIILRKWFSENDWKKWDKKIEQENLRESAFICVPFNTCKMHQKII